ncbi:trimeric intracellular cation channel family protein [Novosphingobium sp. 1949]|uniref:Trimeric intracellular cation channel family protein n=1 Tax=Novosphingobium organovorum TaxID=2930092 RepID=A0ABT0BCV5_9SPHN|nr:trimeric intracellular cation channel family protein [Novosphingobium organovorum]MCJ2182828.1 trimeric intracellular cation channel family protein [Novosphingobium organovorum]
MASAAPLVLVGPILDTLNFTGIAVFAVSGALVAARRRLDVIAAIFFATVAGIGGGTLRDVLSGAPVGWMHSPAPLVLCVLVGVCAWLLPTRIWPERALEWFDAAGLAAFAVVGTGKALDLDVAPLPAVAMGVISACMGGVIRDVVAGVPSILLRNELYITAALLASGVFTGLVLLGTGTALAGVAGSACGFTLRAAAIHWGLRLPRHRG